MTNFRIDIVSDTVCPWCYVGKQKLDRAITDYQSTHPTDTFSTTWKPFYLNPDAPKTGIDKTKYYHAKFGPERTAMMFERLAGIGESVGIHFKFGGKTGNTRDSHRLVQLGKVKGPEVQTRVVEELFKSYFEQEEDITDRQILIAAAVKAGLKEDEARDWLENARDAGGKEVDEEVREAQDSLVSGVPNFTINGFHEISGAQDPSVFRQMFERARKDDIHL